ncbi:MAG: endo-1,4-beta-xylanase, partial [Pirellulales bacterium]|nr:endo-1,4-beta-xylanase [Pirellulales bacterium]
MQTIAVAQSPGKKLSDIELFDGADVRIEKHRKADLVITVIDDAGQPVPGAKVELRQTRHSFLFGCNIFGWSRPSNKDQENDYRQKFKELFNFATLGFYWWNYEPVRGHPNHNWTGLVAEWCAGLGIATKGHPLMWNFLDPPWAPDDLQELQRLQMSRIDDCVSQFKGRIDCWDVVNEATHFDRDWVVKQAPKMSGLWQKTGRMELTRECFAHARKANPQATLLINDYRTDPPYEKVIEQLVDSKGKPMYDVIGIQNHMFEGPWPNQKIWDVCQRFSRFGVPLHFTEMTIFSGSKPKDAAWNAAWPTTPEGETQQARHVVRFYTMLFSHPAVEAITWWNLHDMSSE